MGCCSSATKEEKAIDAMRSQLGFWNGCCSGGNWAVGTASKLAQTAGASEALAKPMAPGARVVGPRFSCSGLSGSFAHDVILPHRIPLDVWEKAHDDDGVQWSRMMGCCSSATKEEKAIDAMRSQLGLLETKRKSAASARRGRAGSSWWTSGCRSAMTSSPCTARPSCAHCGMSGELHIALRAQVISHLCM